MDSYQIPNNSAPFVFSASALNPIALHDTNAKNYSGVGAVAAVVSLLPPDPLGRCFSLGSGEPETNYRNAGRSGSGVGGRKVVASKGLQPGNGMRSSGTASRHEFLNHATSLSVATTSPGPLPLKQGIGRGSAGVPSASQTCTSFPPALMCSFVSNGQASGHDGSASVPGLPADRPDSLPSEAERDSANALDQLINLLLLPEDGFRGYNQENESLLSAAATGNATASSCHVVQGLCLPSDSDTTDHPAQDSDAAVGAEMSAVTAAFPIRLQEDGDVAMDKVGQPDMPSDISNGLVQVGHRSADGVLSEGGGGVREGSLLGLDSLAAALDEVDACLDLRLDFSLSLQEVDSPHGFLPRSFSGLSLACLDTETYGTVDEEQKQPRMRRPKKLAKRTGGTSVASVQASPGNGRRVDTAALEGSIGGDGECWKVMLASPMPHNPEALAILLLAGRLINPQTAVPAPLLAAATREHQQQRQKQDRNRSAGAEPLPEQQQQNQSMNRVMVATAAGQGPAVSLIRCTSLHDAAAALELDGRRLYSPPPISAGGDNWRPLKVVLLSQPGQVLQGGLGAASQPPSDAVPLSSLRRLRIREAGPCVRRVVLRGLPGHIDGDDVIALFGNGLQLPGQCAIPQDRRFLVLCPDLASFKSLMEWSGTRLPEKPLDALQQIVPRVTSWSTVCVEEDDGIQLPALVSQLMQSARLPGRGVATVTTNRQHQQQYPRVVGRFHPADLDDLVDMAGRTAVERRGDAALTEGAAVAAAALARLSVGAKDAEALPASEGGDKPSATTPLASVVRAPASHMRGTEDRMDAQTLDATDEDAAAAAAERAESSRGASSSGLAARPAPRFRRAAVAAAGHHMASTNADRVIFGPAIAAGTAATDRCACCPSLPSAGRGGSDVGALSWSCQPAVEMLNKLLALGIEPAPSLPSQGGGIGSRGGDGSVREEDRAPFFRRNRKRMPLHFGMKPEDEEYEEVEEEAGSSAKGVHEGCREGADDGTQRVGAVEPR